MNLKLLATKLRQAADVLDDLLGVERATKHETPTTATAIRKTFVKPKRSFHGKHWTQTPEGKARLARNGRRMWRQKRKADDEIVVVEQKETANDTPRSSA